MLGLGLEQPPYTICTDNGIELAGSQEVWNTANKHGYSVETTAPDASSQSGISKRPHRTLKEKVQCLLYTAGLGTAFWSDALLHAVWLYNRTYHSAIGMTPHQRWLGPIPTLDNLLTFGSKITSKKAKNQTMALDPNAFEGIFLGYGSTMKNIIYWDTMAHQKQSAKHGTANKVQYGDPSSQRSPASKFLIEITTGEPHDQQRTDILLEKPRKLNTNKHNQPLPADPLRIIIDSPLPTAAAAAKAKFERPTPAILHHQLKMLDITLNVYKPAVNETLPLQGSHLKDSSWSHTQNTKKPQYFLG
jgi:hypothetical protein